MRLVIIFLFLGVATATAGDRLLNAIAVVESGGRSDAVGDSGRAVGLYQLHCVYVDDVNRIAGTTYTYKDRTDPIKSAEMVRIYLKHYGCQYIRTTGRRLTFEVLARIHNGGPHGYSKPSTLRYWIKVRAALESDRLIGGSNEED